MANMTWACLVLIFTSILQTVWIVSSEDLVTAPAEILPTITVRGFLNFRTTVDNTVIVFTPAKSDKTDKLPSPSKTIPSIPSTTVPDNAENSEIQDLAYTQTHGILKPDQDLENVLKDSYSPKLLHNDLPSEESHSVHSQTSTFRSFKKLPITTSKQVAGTVAQQLTPTLPQYPIGLVTVVTGKSIQDGTTMVLETSVIGTYIDGKYAQILKSTSKLGSLWSDASSPLETIQNKIEPSVTKAIQFTPSSPSSTSKNKSPQLTSQRETSATEFSLLDQKHKIVEKKKDNGIASNTVLQSSFKPIDPGLQLSSNPTQSLDTGLKSTSSRSRFRLRSTTSKSSNQANTFIKLHTSRRSTERFRYIPRQRNTHTVQLNRFKVKLTSRLDDKMEEDNLKSREEEETEEEDEDNTTDNPSTFIDPARVIYELATITSEVTLHVGRRKSVRTLTITTSLQRTLEPSELASYELDATETVDRNKALVSTDGSSYYVFSRTYSTTEHSLRTSLVSTLDGEDMVTHTITESFFIRKLITAYRTLPANDLFLLNHTLESNVELPFNSSLTDDLQDDLFLPQSTLEQQMPQTRLPLETSNLDSSMLSLSNSRNLPLQISNPLLSLNQNPLAAVYLGLQQLNRQVTLYSTITKKTSYITTDTVYSTKVVRYYDGRITRSRTLSESLSTKTRTITTLTTIVQPIINTQALQQQQQLQQLIGTQLQPPVPQQYSTVTSSYTTVTTAISTSTRIYTLIYNAFSTKYRTVTSTSPYKTTITTYSTSQVPILATSPPGGAFQFYG